MKKLVFIFNKFYKVKLTGLRFFTIYGEWGRPDMMMLKFIESYFKKKLLNYIILGTTLETLHTLVMPRRLCTYSLKKHSKLKSFDIFNICSNNPVKLDKIISFMKKNNIHPKIKKLISKSRYSKNARR